MSRLMAQVLGVNEYPTTSAMFWIASTSSCPSSTQVGLSSGSISIRYEPGRVAAGGCRQIGRRDDPVAVGRHLDGARRSGR